MLKYICWICQEELNSEALFLDHYENDIMTFEWKQYWVHRHYKICVGNLLSVDSELEIML